MTDAAHTGFSCRACHGGIPIGFGRVSPDAAEIRNLLSEGREEELLGLAESESLDFKAQPYALQDQEGGIRFRRAWELAKDAAAMANCPQGGCIVLGVRTTPSSASSDDVAVEVSPFPSHLLNPQQYQDTIEAHAYPPIRGVGVLKFNRDDGCLGLIEVPPPQGDDGPFLLKKIVDSDGNSTEGFAMPVRDGSHTRWQPVGTIHRDIADGRRSRRGGSIPAGDPGPADAAQASLESRLAADVTMIENYMDWHDSAVYALTAAPVSPPSRIDNFYVGDLRQSFASPSGLRYSGFGIGYRQEPRLEDKALVAVDGDFRYRRLERDGRLLVAIKAEESFLGRTHQLPTGQARPLTINHVALVEFTYEFCRFHKDVLQPHVPPSEWHLAVLVRGAQSRPWSLHFGRWADREAQSDEWIEVIEAGEDPAVNAYELLRRVCDLFVLPMNELQFVRDGRVDQQAILNLG